MILEHVSQRTHMIVIARSFFHTHRFACGNLHIGNVAVVPEGMKHRIRLLEHIQLLYHRFAQVMVDPENFILSKSLTQLQVQLLGRLQIMAEGLFNHQAFPALGCTQTAFLDIQSNRFKKLRADG
ncbi:hypothetical protein D3C86_1836920 [compost metagenome]